MNKIGLYLHFPFCKAKCKYCDFYSAPSLSLVPSYEKAMVRCVREFASAVGEREVESVYFGGGTPSLMTPDGLCEILSAIRAEYRLSPDAEITLEANPESADERILSAAAKAGVNRISFGMQASQDALLSELGRLHTHADTCRAVERARECGMENISLDLMYGLANQSLSFFEDSLSAALALSPKHISFYLLTLSESIPLYQKRNTLPGEETVREMYLLAHRILEENGFEHYEISNAALPGFASRHNRIYWQGGEYLGLGAGAHSFLDSKRFFLEEDREKFIFTSSFRDMIRIGEVLEEKDRLAEYLMLSLRLASGVDWEWLQTLAPPDFLPKARAKFSLWKQHGLCRKTDRGYALTPEGFFVSNEIISELI